MVSKTALCETHNCSSDCNIGAFAWCEISSRPPPTAISLIEYAEC